MSMLDALYPFAGGLVNSNANTTRMIAMRNQLNELQRQIASGMKSETYGGLGTARVSSLTFHSQTGLIDGYNSVSDLTGTRLKIMDQSTNELRSAVDSARSSMLNTRGTSGYAEITSGVQQIQASFEQMVTSLNAQDGGLYLYSGRSRDVQPVVDANTLIWGDGANAGLRQVIDERRQADAGTGNGRMVTSNVGTTTTLAEDVAGSPFGIKLVAGSAGGGMSNVTVTGPTGSPASIGFNFTGQPITGERLSFSITLPDGSTKAIGFAVDTAGSANDTVFSLGATPAATAANLKSAIDGTLNSLVQGEMRSASALKASDDFFSGSKTVQPPRIQPPFATATSYAALGSRPTVIWYKGDDDTSVSARDTQKAQIDSGTYISFGARANEAALRDSLKGLALVVADDYPPGVASTQDRFDAATGRAITLFNSSGGPNAILEMNSDFGRASSQVADAKSRLTDRKSFLNGLLSDIEGVSTEEVAVKLTSLQTTLQATYQTTATLSRLSLVNYL